MKIIIYHVGPLSILFGYVQQAASSVRLDRWSILEVKQKAQASIV